MKKLTISGLALVLLLASGTAWAGGETGLYLGGSLGSAGIEVSDGSTQYSDSATAYKIFGGFNFGIIPLINLGIEGSYVDFGTASESVSGNKVDTSATGWDLFGLVGVNMGPVSLFGKVGAILWDGKSSSGSDSGTDAAYGVGLQLQISSFAIRAEYEIFSLDKVDIGFVSAGVSYTF
jgi:outer membrane immunogenic protein